MLGSVQLPSSLVPAQATSSRTLASRNRHLNLAVAPRCCSVSCTAARARQRRCLILPCSMKTQHQFRYVCEHHPGVKRTAWHHNTCSDTQLLGRWCSWDRSKALVNAMASAQELLGSITLLGSVSQSCQVHIPDSSPHTPHPTADSSTAIQGPC